MISVQSITKEFIPRKSSAQFLKDIFSGIPKNSGFKAIEDINFEVNKGEVVGIIGKNGAGKSTLLQIICGTLKPTRGEIFVSGKIGALLELGAGFHPEFTGIENIYLSGATVGLRKSEIDKFLDNIIEFAELGNFINKPVKTYSSGMLMRLAFSVSTCVCPEVLVVDEVLSVGDQEFSQKCLDRILELKNNGTTILFCSHSIYQVEALCDRAIWLHKGKIKSIGQTKHVTMLYNEYEMGKTCKFGNGSFSKTSVKKVRTATYFTHIDFYKNGELVQKETAYRSRLDDFSVKVGFTYQRRTPTLALSVRKPNGEIVASAGSLNDKSTHLDNDDGTSYFKITINKIPLLMGNYSVDINLFCEHGIQTLDSVQHIFTLRVVQEDLEQGIVNLGHAWGSSHLHK